MKHYKTKTKYLLFPITYHNTTYWLERVEITKHRVQGKWLITNIQRV